MTKKNPWILGLSLAALISAPALPALAASSSKASKSDTKAAEAKVEKTDKAEVKATDTAEASADAKPAVHHKSPFLAGVLGVIPGIAIHGTGHMYAGSWMKGLGLLAVEGAAVGIAAANISTLNDDLNAIDPDKNGSKGGIPLDFSTAYTKLGILTVCGAAFLWSWFDDMAGAPIAANEYNKIQDQGASASLQLAPRGDGVQVALSTPF